jgi:hypothetical protein
MTITATRPTNSSRQHRHYGRRSPGITIDPVWIDETTFTLSEIRRARERNAPSRRRS